MQTQNFYAAATGGYSAMTSVPLAGKTYTKLLIFFPGSVEVGDGSPAALEALALHGPIAPYRAGVTWFDDNGIIVAAIQPPSTVNFGTAQTTVHWLQSHFGISPAHTYLTGLSLGGGVAMSYCNRFGAVAGVLAIEPASYGPANLSFWAGAKSTIYTNWDDGVAPSSWAMGAPDGGAVTFLDSTGKNLGWLQGITGTCPLDNHPDHPTAIAHSGGPKLSGITAKCTGLWNGSAWSWVNGTDLTTPATHRVIFSPTGGHGGWDAIYGTDVASFQPSIMAAFLEVPAPAVVPAVVDPCAAISAQLTTAQSALAATNAVATSATALATSAQAALDTEKAAHASDVAMWAADKALLATATTQVNDLSAKVTDLTNQVSILMGQVSDAVTATRAANDALAAEQASHAADNASNLAIKQNLADSLHALQTKVQAVQNAVSVAAGQVAFACNDIVSAVQGIG